MREIEIVRIFYGNQMFLEMDFFMEIKQLDVFINLGISVIGIKLTFSSTQDINGSSINRDGPCHRNSASISALGFAPRETGYSWVWTWLLLPSLVIDWILDTLFDTKVFQFLDGPNIQKNTTVESVHKYILFISISRACRVSSKSWESSRAPHNSSIGTFIFFKRNDCLFLQQT